MTQLSLLRQHSPLADPAGQLQALSQTDAVPQFAAAIASAGLPVLGADDVKVLQVNVGKVCNQTCRHCHVDAGPDRRESMSAAVAAACISFLARSTIKTLDITGGAPEMNPNFRLLVEQGRRLGRRVIDRCNLTILLAPGYEDLPEFLAKQQVEIVASLPCYLEENCDRQRGEGVFARSIAALRRLNALGYGRRPELPLTLVYNPVGFSLPPGQSALEAEYRQQLNGRFGVEFTRLIAIANMPISRFLADLLAAGQFDAYLRKLLAAFNPATVDGLMCRTTLSVDWQGYLYDCDFNQMLALRVASPTAMHIESADLDLLRGRPIVTGRHCYGCTAGAGSGCAGAIRVDMADAIDADEAADAR